jgi:hypothetical protein
LLPPPPSDPVKVQNAKRAGSARGESIKYFHLPRDQSAAILSLSLCNNFWYRAFAIFRLSALGRTSCARSGFPPSVKTIIHSQQSHSKCARVKSEQHYGSYVLIACPQNYYFLAITYNFVILIICEFLFNSNIDTLFKP